MGTALMYGLYVSAANILLSLIMHFAGLWGPDTMWIGYLAFVFLTIGMVMAIKDRRDNENGGDIRFGQAFSTGFTVVLVSAIVGALFFYVYAEFINPDMMTKIREGMEQGLAAKQGSMSEAEYEQAREMTLAFADPAWMAIWQLLGSFLIGSVITVIVAAILKRNPQPQVS